jgi:hypothetical protein
LLDDCLCFLAWRIDRGLEYELQLLAVLGTDAVRPSSQPRSSDDVRAALLALADDLPRLWNHPAASAETRKRILRAVLNEIVVTVEPDRPPDAALPGRRSYSARSREKPYRPASLED